MEIDRKAFLKSSIMLGGCCGMALLSASRPGLSEDAPCPSTTPDPRFSTCQQRMEQGQKVIKRIIAQLDEELDEPTRVRIMESCQETLPQWLHDAKAQVPLLTHQLYPELGLADVQLPELFDFSVTERHQVPSPSFNISQ